MTIPNYQTIMLPLLKLAADQQEHQIRSAIEPLADEFGLDANERSQLLPSGGEPVFNNRVGWARSYLKHAGLIENPRRGMFQITERGIDLLREDRSKIDIKFLERYPEFVRFRKRRQVKEGEPANRIVESEQTPVDSLAAAYEQLHADLEAELLQQVKELPPAFFERLVVDVLVKMGYGGSYQDASRVIGQSGDGGIDGIINEDRLGLDVIYIQAKLWDSTVGRPEIQRFAGALQGQRARKGVFITTSGFSRNAEDYVKNIDSRIILIDGSRLVQLMVEHDVGVSVVATYEVKKIDTDYFSGA